MYRVCRFWTDAALKSLTKRTEICVSAVDFDRGLDLFSRADRLPAIKKLTLSPSSSLTSLSQTVKFASCFSHFSAIETLDLREAHLNDIPYDCDC